MNALGYYAKDKDNNLFQYEWGADDEFSIRNDAGDYVMRDPKDYEIIQVGIITADTPTTEGLTKEQLERRLVIMKQVATQLNDDLAKIGWADEDGFVNTCSVEEAGQEGNIGANLVNLFIIADTTNDHVEKHCLTDAENDALMEKKAKVREWEIIGAQVEINEQFVPSSNLTYMVKFDGVDRFCANLEETEWNKKTVGYDIAPKSIHYTLNRPIEELTQADKECILEYRGLDKLSEEVYAMDVFMEKSHITLVGVDIEIEISVSHRIVPEAGEDAEDILSRGADIYLHSAGEEGYGDKEDLGGQHKIKFT